MLSRKSFWSVTCAVAFVGLASGALLGERMSNRLEFVEAAWARVYESPSEMVQDVDAIALARAVGVEPGRVAYSENGEDALPFEVVSFEVIKGFKGTQGLDTLQVERAGGLTPDGKSVTIDFDGGAFVPGQAYLLFLKRQEDGPYFYQVNHQGRYALNKGLLSAATEGEDAVAQSFDGQSLEHGLGLVRESLKPQYRSFR
jgi:hypothetical protein